MKTQENPLYYECSECGASPQEPCSSKRIHLPRRTLARNFRREVGLRKPIEAEPSWRLGRWIEVSAQPESRSKNRL
jgi:hypothetical protein